MSLPTVQDVTNPFQWGFGVAINGVLLRVTESERNQLQTAPLDLQRVVSGENPEDFVGENILAFSRTEFNGGEALLTVHRREPSEIDYRRYWDSYGVKIHPNPCNCANRNSFQLLRDTTQLDANTTGRAVLTPQGVLYARSTTAGEVRRYASPHDTAPTVETAASGESLSGIAAVGSEVFVIAATSGLVKRSTGGSWSVILASATSGDIWGAKGRLLWADGLALKEVTTDGTVVGTVATLPDGESWVSVTDAGSHIVAAGTNGYLYGLTVNSSANLELDFQYPFPEEEVTAVASSQGLVVICTRQADGVGGWTGRLWSASIGADGLSFVDLIRVWVGAYPSAVWAGRDGALVSVTSPSGYPSETHLWNYSYSSKTTSRNLIFSQVEVDSIHLVGERVIVASNSGLHHEDTVYRSSGWLISPLADFFTAREKLWGKVTADYQRPANTSVKVFYSTSSDALDDPTSPNWIRILTDTINEAPMSVSSRWLAAKIEIATTNTSRTPSFEGFSFQAYPPPPGEVIDMTINLSDRIELPYRRSFDLPNYGVEVSQFLRSIERRPVTVDMYRWPGPNRRFRGVVRAVQVPTLSEVERGSPHLFGSISLLVDETPPIATAEGNPWGGVLMWGEGIWGGS